VLAFDLITSQLAIEEISSALVKPHYH